MEYLKHGFYTGIKVCGLTDTRQVKELEQIGVQMAGFNFYKESRRYAGNKIHAGELKDLKLRKIGVFVNEGFEELMRIVGNYDLDMVQLHGDETPEFCSRLKGHVPVIKALRISESTKVGDLLRLFGDSSDLFLFDTWSAGYGGSGKKFSWELITEEVVDTPFLLGGGIGPSDVESIRIFSKMKSGKNLLAVDLNSRFEESPGIKDLGSIRLFAENLWKQ